MADRARLQQALAVPIALADEVAKTAEEASSFKTECSDLKRQVERLSGLLRQAARHSGALYERPAARMLADLTHHLDKALLLVTKCRRNALLKRVFTITSAAAFRKVGTLLDSSAGDLTWLLTISGCSSSSSSSTSDDNHSIPHDDDPGSFLGLPPIATNDPMLGMIWEQIARLQYGRADEKSDAAASLVSLAQDSDRNGKIIVEEGGIAPLLKLLKDGALPEAQDTAARALGKLARDAESVRQMVHEGVCTVFANVLKEGTMKVQATVAWALSELLANDPEFQAGFSHADIIRSLVAHLAFETIPEHSRYTVPAARSSMHSVVASVTRAANMSPAEAAYARVLAREQATAAAAAAAAAAAVVPSLNYRGRESEEPVVKLALKTEAARALWRLSRRNPRSCRSITESKALLCFATILEKGKGEIRRFSALAVMEIAAVAEENPDLRRAAFKTSSPAAKALVEQLLRVVVDGDPELLMPCIRAIGCLARSFSAKEARLIEPLVKHLDHRDLGVAREAAVALRKFACSENYLHAEHSRAIIEACGVPHLVQLVYFGEDKAQAPALALLCYLALHAGDSEALAKNEALSAMEWASKQGSLVQDPLLEHLIPEAKSRLELYQSRGQRIFHGF